MNSLGVIECYFGPMWSDADRRSYAHFLADNGFGFYIYAPKADALLRKRWVEDWSGEYLANLEQLSEEFRQRNVRFGVGLSPFGVQNLSSVRARDLLEKKTGALVEAGVDIIGVFFDDMPMHDGLAETQIRIIEGVKGHAGVPIVYCPSYYSFDPILDEVFGSRPESYLRDIGQGIPGGVEILWTGPRVISEEISETHLAEVSHLLRRSPFICDNIFANDGPRNCKYLKLKAAGGRTPNALGQTSYWAFNPMNQAELSKIVLHAAKAVLLNDVAPTAALELAEDTLCTREFSRFLRSNRRALVSQGLDEIPKDQKNAMSAALGGFSDAGAKEIADWLNGRYSVGSECLTD